MEYVESPRHCLDQIPRTCQFCTGAIWRARLCPKCGAVACGGCTERCPACRDDFVRCPLIDAIITGNEVVAVREKCAVGSSVRFRYTEDADFVISKDDIPTTCALCVSAICDPQQCRACGKVVCGECALKTKDKCPMCRDEPTCWIPLSFLVKILSTNKTRCSRCKKEFMFDEHHRCPKRVRRQLRRGQRNGNSILASAILEYILMNSLV